jgi:hypothetical protein
VRPADRKALLEALAEELSSGTIRFSSKLVSINTETAESSPETAKSSPETAVLRLDDGTVIRAKVRQLAVAALAVHISTWLA